LPAGVAKSEEENVAMNKLALAAAAGALVALSACGTSQKERTTGGAAAGAATGAGIGALGGPVGVAAGAVIGGGAGAITGATTSPKDVNLGKPVWTNPEARVPTPSGTVAPATGETTRKY
jgi:hypothetical protein